MKALFAMAGNVGVSVLNAFACSEGFSERLSPPLCDGRLEGRLSRRQKECMEAVCLCQLCGRTVWRHRSSHGGLCNINKTEGGETECWWQMKDGRSRAT